MTAGQKKWLSAGLTVISLSAGLALNANILKAQAATQPTTDTSSSSVSAVTASEPTSTEAAANTKELELTGTKSDATKVTEKQSVGNDDGEKDQATGTDGQTDVEEQSAAEKQTDTTEKASTGTEPSQNQHLPSSGMKNPDETADNVEKISDQQDQSAGAKPVQQVTTASEQQTQTVPLVRLASAARIVKLKSGRGKSSTFLQPDFWYNKRTLVWPALKLVSKERLLREVCVGLIYLAYAQ